MASGSFKVSPALSTTEKHDVGNPAPELQLELRAASLPDASREEALKWREAALSLREELLARREEDLDRREANLILKEATFNECANPAAALRKLPCQMCNVEGRKCGRGEPCFDEAGYLLHHHHTCTACHDARKAQRRSRRAGRHS